MVHTVGIFGVSGNVGAATLPRLSVAARNGEIKLIIFHRESSSVDNLPTGQNIELRVLDYVHSPAQIEEAVKGVNVFISVVGAGALPNEPNLVNALAKSPDLVTFMPAMYSTTWNQQEINSEPLGTSLRMFHRSWDLANERQVGTTVVYTGVFDQYFFGFGFSGTSVKTNTLWANQRQMQNRFPITTVEHLGSTIARLAASDPKSIKDKEYTAVTFWASGEELRDLLTDVNGEPATVKDFSMTDREEILKDLENFGPVRIGYIDRWIDDRWEYDTRGRIAMADASGFSLEDVARKYL